MYNSKYYTCEQIDQRLLEGYYDDAVAAGYTGSKAQYLAGLLKAINYAANPTLTADKVVYDQAISGLTSKNVKAAIDELANKKADKAAVDELANKKADKAAVDELANKKADKAAVDVELAKKFDKESVVQSTGESEDKVMSQKAVNNKFNDLYELNRIKNITVGYLENKSTYFDISPDDYFFGNRIVRNNDWNCQCFFIKANNKFICKNLNDNKNICAITKLDGTIIKKEFNNELLVFSYDVFVYLSVNSNNKQFEFIYNPIYDIVRKENTINKIYFPYKNTYYLTNNLAVGDKINFYPLNIANGWNSICISIKKGNSIEIFGKIESNYVKYIPIVNGQNEIIELLRCEDYYRTYTASSDCYALISSNTDKLKIVMSNIIYNYLDILLSNNKISTEQFYFKDYVYPNSLNIGDAIHLIPYNSAKGYNSIILPLTKGDIVEFYNLSYDEYVKLYYIVSYDKKIIYKASTQHNDIYEATTNCYILISSKTGYIVTDAGKLSINNLSKIIDAEYSSNLYKYNVFSSIIKNTYIDLNGKNSYNTNFITSDYIKLGHDSQLILDPNILKAGVSDTIAFPIAFYDKNFKFLKGYSNVELASFVESKKVYIKDISENYVYYRVCGNVENLNNHKVFSYRESINISETFKYDVDIIWNNGFYITRNGDIDNNKDWSYTNFIEIYNNINIYVKGSLWSGNNALNIAFYNVNKVFISGIYTSNSYYDDIVNIPTDAYYMSISTRIVDIPSISVKTNNIVLCNNYSKKEVIDIVSPKYLDVVENKQTDIFLDNIIAETEDCKSGPLVIKSKTRFINRLGNYQLRYTPTADSPSDIEVNIMKYNDNKLQDLNNTSTIHFRKISINNGNRKSLNICIAGDSLIDGTDAPCEAFRLLNEDGDCIINQIGTRRANRGSITYFHEGRGSWSWADYINPLYENTENSGKKNAFMINGELNFQKYMNDNFTSLERKEIDYFIMSLGTNDVTQGYSYPSDKKIETIINNAKTFLNALLSEDKGFPNCKVAIGLPSVGAPYFTTTNSSDTVFKMSILKLNRKYIDTFDNGKYHPNVTCVMHGAYIDRYDSYQHEDIPVSNYTSRLIRHFTNEVHPASTGYKQFGNGYYGKLRAFISNML